ncbi:hypothetical protein MHD_05435 [Mannheimia granulomatis]|uniref:Uncharacterized protein n=1 Tax=Mannheimia granulomatis TaxID=85402 RepID=A0A011LWT1_9PAST|nr:hypothetical protein [Mannheimia granulomatis]EXI61673.1 hypothetical protein AK33_08780 [Mannheimia granulomatis]RGE48550.1 hypothetical protein MHD_05435 [Mannheimia granulomatis]
METVFAYCLVGVVIFMLLIPALTGIAWVASVFILIFSVLITPFVFIIQLFGNVKDKDESNKKALIAYHQCKYGIIEKSGK